MLANDLVQYAVNALTVKEFLADPSFNATAAGANQRGKDGPAQSVLEAESHGVHATPLKPTYWFLLGSL